VDRPTHATLRPIFEELKNDRVVIRPYRLDDAGDLFTVVVASREHLLPWLPWAMKYAVVEDARDTINRMAAAWLLCEGFDAGLWDASTGRLVGGCGLHPRDWAVPSFEIGYWLRADMTGHGYITEAVKLLTDYTFDTFSAKRVAIQCDARNERSAAVPRRLGFVHEATLRDVAVAYDNTLRSTLIFALTPDDPRWPAR
jgi:RimJ/RimL family protein N-acetyltransferase